MSSLGQYDGWTVDEIVARNSHELTALHVLNARAYIVEQREENAVRVAGLLTALTEAQEIGRRVLAAKRAGRKTVRIADLTGGDK